MSENSKIEWTDHTFNPWWGCRKVSDGCKNCYAETLDNRWKGGHWGPGSSRRVMSEAYWAQPIKWNAAAEKAGTPAKVFCASMADVFEDHPDVLHLRGRLVELIEETPFLTWQLLTKRPENIMRLIPERWNGEDPLNEFPPNVWIGTSVENQKAAGERIPHLLRVPAAIKFLSCEPLLGPLDLTEYMILTDSNATTTVLANERGWGYDDWSGGFRGPGQMDSCYDARCGIQWVIAGGESGPHSRPMHPDWARRLRDQCKYAEVAFFFKQWGELLPACQADYIDVEFGTDAQKRFFPSPHNPEKRNVYYKAGKKANGRLLDGIEHNEFPAQ